MKVEAGGENQNGGDQDKWSTVGEQEFAGAEKFKDEEPDSNELTEADKEVADSTAEKADIRPGESAQDLIGYYDKCYRDFEAFGKEVTGKTVDQMNPKLVSEQLFLKTSLNKMRESDPSSISAEQLFENCDKETALLEEKLQGLSGREAKRLQAEIDDRKDMTKRLRDTYAAYSESLKAPAEKSTVAEEVDYSQKTGADLLAHLEEIKRTAEAEGKTAYESDWHNVASLVEQLRHSKGTDDISVADVLSELKDKLEVASKASKRVSQERTDKAESLNFFSRRFGRGAQELRNLEREDVYWFDQFQANQRQIALIENMYKKGSGEA